MEWSWVLLAGAVGAIIVTILMAGSQGLGLSRMSFPFMLGTLFTSNRDHAHAIGFAMHFVLGWLFAFIYVALFVRLGASGGWAGMVIGAFHGLFVLTGIMPLLPYIHPRMATDDEGPTPTRMLEPPGFMGLNYGRRTPVITMLAHLAYGATIGLLLPY